MFLSALLISACNNQNGTISGDDNNSTVNIKNKIRKGNTNDNFPATPEPIPPGKGEIVIEPMPLPKEEDQYTVVYETEKYKKRKALSQAIKRSEEHTSELQSRGHLVCRLLLEKKNTS